MSARARDAHPGVARARRQGPDDRARRRRPRARGQRRRLLLDAERRPDLHLDRARLRRGAGLRRVRRQGHREGRARCARACPTGRARSTSARSRSRRSSTSSSRHVEQAPRRGRARARPAATRATGAGRFFEPTVLVDVDHSMECMTEETFGPTLPIMKVADADEAVRLANDSPYGLGASVWTQGHRARRGDRPPDRGRRGVRQRRADQLPRARAADGRLEGRPGLGVAPRRRRASASTARQQAILVTRFAPKRTCTCSRTRRARRGCSAGVRAALRARQARLGRRRRGRRAQQRQLARAGAGGRGAAGRGRRPRSGRAARRSRPA